ncbi:MAG: hypothetical protein CMP51_06640 [Flavobacteriales bacterium]|nr:hypothetical protein [Flavobacteriales bacterium]|tara:strand:+ start:514 stop:1629 length:1116 start_codon:yes stop_codon:yes gene_type:complete
MRIGFDAKRAFHNYSGLGNYSRNTINIMSKKYLRDDFFLYTYSQKSSYTKSIKNIKNITIQEPLSFAGRLSESYWRSFSIKNDLKKDKIDLFHGLSNEIPFGIKKTNIKTIVTIHDLIFLKFPKFYKSIDRNIYLKKIKYACSTADLIIAISNQTKSDLINLLCVPEEKIRIVYQGCDDLFQQKHNMTLIPSKKHTLPKKYILYVGDINPRKNLLLILEAMIIIKNLKLVIVGEGKKYKTICQKFICKNKLESRVYFFGKVHSKDLINIYSNADIMIYPSLYEGFGIPILESLFLKVPVITSNGSCLRETGGNGAMYIDPYSKESLIEAIVKIQEDTNLRETLIDNGWKHAQKFTNDKISTNIMKVYSELL